MSHQVALITGGASGIGKATALKLAAQGITVVISGRREDLGQAAVEEIKHNAGISNETGTSAALDYATQGIRINGVAPGAIKTDIIAAQLDGSDENYNEDIISAMHPMNRLGKPEEIANGIARGIESGRPRQAQTRYRY
ncbi:hypothetical protein B4900_17040 [Yersinia rohdei]|nr:hypothetical protein B4900_17040 [Yersinia rohdei]